MKYLESFTAQAKADNEYGYWDMKISSSHLTFQSK